jgi:hypothetical protein
MRFWALWRFGFSFKAASSQLSILKVVYWFLLRFKMCAYVEEERRMFLRGKWEALEGEEKLLQDEKLKLSKAWQGVEKKREKYEKDKKKFDTEAKKVLEFIDGDEVITLNVGGKAFPIDAKHLMADQFSVLAYLCTADCIKNEKVKTEGGKDNHYFIDRDWWIFRHIHLFLIDGTLPQSVTVLRELYYEASFYRLTLLRYAIETRILDEEQRKLDRATEHKPNADYGGQGHRSHMGGMGNGPALASAPLPDVHGFTGGAGRAPWGAQHYFGEPYR